MILESKPIADKSIASRLTSARIRCELHGYCNIVEFHNKQRRLGGDTVRTLARKFFCGGVAMEIDSPINRMETVETKARDEAEEIVAGSFEVVSPLDGELVGAAPDMGPLHVQRAIAVAAAAGADWKRRPPRERARLLHAWSEAIMANKAALASLVRREQGKPLAQAEAEVAYGASFVDWYAEEGRRVYGEIVQADRPDQRILVTREPVGVCAAITPWNYPLAMVTRKVAPALAAGCTVVLKPAEATPLTALEIARLAIGVGIPPGVLNIVTARDPAPIGEEFARSKLVRHLSFTGSARVGRLLMELAAGTIKRCTMELGGNAPFLVLEDADLDKAAAALVTAKFRNGGQTCVCPNRVLVQRKIYNAFTKAVVERMTAMSVGQPGNEISENPPLISLTAVERVNAWVEHALAEGASPLFRGSVEPKGHFVVPIVLGSVTPSMEIYQQEVFGPVLSLTAFDEVNEAIAMANDTSAGLAAYIFSGNLGLAIRLSEMLEFGMVGINEVAISQDTIPFGGIKESGLGRESSKLGIEEYLEWKTVCMAL